MKYKLTIIAIILICFQSFAQITKLDSLRTKNISNSNKKKYNAEIIHKKELQENPPLIPTIAEYKKNKTVRLFNIKKEDRKQLYPFNSYNSIYFAITKKDSIIDYLKKDSYNKINLLNEKEIQQISNILFNYFELNYVYKIGLITEVGCDCPTVNFDIVLLFSKNGKIEKYLAFPLDKNITNFTESEYNQLDLNEKKEEMILRLLKKYFPKTLNQMKDSNLPKVPTPIPIK